MNLQLLRALIRKDIKLFMSDRRAMIITFMVPIGLASFFAMIMGGSGAKSGETAKIPIMVVNQDNSKVSSEIVASLQKDKALKVQMATEKAARDSVLRGKTTVALVLPPNFGRDSSRAMFNGAKPIVTLLYDPAHNIELQMLRGILTQQVVQAASKSAFSPDTAPQNLDAQFKSIEAAPDMNPQQKAAFKDLFGSLKNYYQKTDAGTAGAGGSASGGATSPLGGGLQMPCEMKEEAVAASKGSSDLSGAAHTFSGMAMQGLLFWAIDAAIGILRERKQGLWKRLRAAPLTRGLLLAGKIGSSTLISLLTLLVVFGWGALFFHVRIQGSVLGFVLVSCCTAFMAATFGLLIAALGRTEQQSRGYAIPAVLAMAILGGAWFPSFMMPKWVQTISLAMPSRWAVDGFDAMTWRGLGLDAALQSSLVLLGFAAAFWLVAFTRFRWEADG